MKVLQDWDEIGSVVTNIRKTQLPCHSDVYKDWDLWNIYKLVKDMDRDIHIFDFGCAGCRVLKFLSHIGFRHIYGMDLYESKRSFIFEDKNKVFSKDEIKDMLDLSEKNGFLVDGDIPKCKDKVVCAHGRMYTFISGVFKKTT